MPLIRAVTPIRIGPSGRTVLMRIDRALVALLIGLPACSPAVTAPSKPMARVAVEHISFQPAVIRVTAGTALTWTNRDVQVTHTITSGIAGDKGIPGVDEGRPNEPDGIFTGELDGAGSRFTFTFDDPGSFDYFCEVHPVMTASVIVDR